MKRTRKVIKNERAPTAADLESARDEATQQIERAKRAHMLRKHYVAISNALHTYANVRLEDLQTGNGDDPVRAALEAPYAAIEEAVGGPIVIERLARPLRDIAEALFQALYKPTVATVWSALQVEQSTTTIELGKLTTYFDRPPIAGDEESLAEAMRRVLLERGFSSYAAVRATRADLRSASSRALPSALTRAAQRQANRVSQEHERRLAVAQERKRYASRKDPTKMFQSTFAPMVIERANAEIAAARAALQLLRRGRRKPKRTRS